MHSTRREFRRQRPIAVAFRQAGANTPAQAALLAEELARLMDMVETENVPLDGLATLVPRRSISEHWKDTLKFLEIITAFWPAVPRGKEVCCRRRRAATARSSPRRSVRHAHAAVGLPSSLPACPGSVPATVELMAAVARLPQGAIVLPAPRHCISTMTAGRRSARRLARRLIPSTRSSVSRAARRARRRCAPTCSRYRAPASAAERNDREALVAGGHAPLRHDGTLAAVHRGRGRRRHQKRAARSQPRSRRRRRRTKPRRSPSSCARRRRRRP